MIIPINNGMDQKPERDSKGRFLKGHRLLAGNAAGRKLEPGEVQNPHPKFPWLDTKGRYIGGIYSGPHPAPRAITELKRALVNSVHPEQVKKVITHIYTMATSDKYEPHLQLAACQLWLNRVLGMPAKEVFAMKDVRNYNANVNVDLTKLSEHELQTWKGLLEKTKPDIEIVVDNGEPSSE